MNNAFGGDGMYNEKNEMEKVNFGDLPVDWEDDVEFAIEQFDEEASIKANHKKKTRSLTENRMEP